MPKQPMSQDIEGWFAKLSDLWQGPHQVADSCTSTRLFSRAAVEHSQSIRMSAVAKWRPAIGCIL